MPHLGVSWKRITQDDRVIHGELALHWLLVGGALAGVADVTIYDGNDTGGRQFGQIRQGAGNAQLHPFDPPARFVSGLYCDMGATVPEVVVGYTAIPDELDGGSL